VPDWLLILLALTVLPLMLLAFVSAGFETDLFTLRRYHLRSLAPDRSRLGRWLRFLLQNIEENRIRVSLLAALFESTAILLVLVLLHQFFPASRQELRVPVAAVGTVLALVIVFPKALSLCFPGVFLRRFSRAFIRLIPALRPFSSPLLRGSARLEQFLFPASLQAQPDSYTETEFETLLEMQRERGALHENESHLISEFIRLGNKTASDCMTARVHAFALPAGLSRKEIFSRLEGNNWHKVPIYHQSLDQITGILDVRRALLDPEQNLGHSIEPPVFVSGLMPALTVFRDSLAKPHSMVIVLDEYGGTQGVLTHEDILEEIMGRLPEETAKPPAVIRKIGDRLVLASGGARIDEVEEALGVELDGGGLDTIGGLVFNQLGQAGRMPNAGDRIALGPAHAIIRRIGEKRIEEVLVERDPAE